MMRKVSYFFTLDSLKTAYFAHFQSLLQHGIICWGSSTTLHKLLIMQKRKMKVMLGLIQWTSCREKFKELQILNIPSLHILN